MKRIIVILGIVLMISECYSQRFEKIFAINDTFFILPKSVAWTKFMDCSNRISVDSLPDGKWYWNSGTNKYYFSIRNNCLNGNFIRTDSTQNILETGSFKNGFQHGFFKYYVDGDLASTRLFEYGNSREEILYYRNGSLKRKFTTVKTSSIEELTLCTFYHENGFISSQGYNGLNGKTGIWEYFDIDGIKLKEESYKNGELVSQTNTR